MHIEKAMQSDVWDAFLSRQRRRPFLQSWTMGEVYSDIGQASLRLQAVDNGTIVGVAFGHIVHAKRGVHCSVPYGPVVDDTLSATKRRDVASELLKGLSAIAKEHRCWFIRWSPFEQSQNLGGEEYPGSRSSPLHMLAEHVWYLPLVAPDPWNSSETSAPTPRSEEDILQAMRKTTRNLIRRAERDGVSIEASVDPLGDLEQHFLRLHDETQSRHGFTPYSSAFFRAQVKRFSANRSCTVYLARYNGEVLASSIHVHAFGETSYHHGASSRAQSKVPASHLLQWRAVCDALRRGDRIYNFWGIAPEGCASHPFQGVTLFKTGFGGTLYPLKHCRDLPLSSRYWLTAGFETLRKWRRGF